MTKHGSTALGLNTHSSSSSSSLGWTPFSRPTKESNPGSSLSTTSGSDPIRPAMTRHTSIARFTCMNLNSSSISSGTAACARHPDDCVEIPSILGENPLLMIPQMLQYWLLHMPEAPFSPKSQRKVAQWNLNSSLPSAMHRSSLLLPAMFRAAFDFTCSLYSSNRVRIFGLL